MSKPSKYLNKIKNFDENALYEFKNKNIITDLYLYYFYNGFNSILAEKTIHLIISYILIFIFNFLINCVDYDSLINLQSSRESIYTYIHLENWVPKNPYLIICFVLYSIYLFCITINYASSIKKFYKIKKIYNYYLNLDDGKLRFISWDQIIQNIISKLSEIEKMDNTITNIYTINNKICQQSNLIIALSRTNYLTIPKMSKFLEWNLIYCIIDPIITKSKTHPQIQINSRYPKNTINPSDTNNPINPTNPYNPSNPYNPYNPTSSTILQIIDNIDNMNNNQIYDNFTTSATDCLNQPLLSVNDSPNITTNTTHTTHTSTNQLNYSLDNVSIYSNTPPDSLNNSTHSQNSSSSNNNNYNNNNYNAIKYNRRIDNYLYNSIIPSRYNQEIRNYDEYLEKVKYRINLVLGINIIALPFTLVILVVYLIIKYGEKIYSNPSLLYERQINIKTRWQLRYFNELPNLFKDRLKRIQRNMDKIINVYNSIIIQVVYRFIIFLVGSIFLILLVLSFISTKYFAELYIIGNHNVIWLLGILGTMLLILNKNSNNSSKIVLSRKEQIDVFNELKEDLITILPRNKNTNTQHTNTHTNTRTNTQTNTRTNTHTNTSQNDDDEERLVKIINNIYEYKIYSVWREVCYLIMTPYYILKWRKEIKTNYANILDLIDNHHDLGYVCKYSVFTNPEILLNNPHSLLSLKEFKNNHKWQIPDIIHQPEL